MQIWNSLTVTRPNMIFFQNSRCRTAAILKIVFGHNSAADCPISVKFCVRKQFVLQNFDNGTDTGVLQNVFFCFPKAV